MPRGEQGNIGVRIKPEMPPGLFKVTPASLLTDITALWPQLSPELSQVLALDIYEMDEVRSNTIVSSELDVDSG